jgi:hypothetical protein
MKARGGGSWCTPRRYVGVSGQRHAPVSLPPRKRRGISFTGHQCLSGQVWNISPPLGFDPRTIPLVVSRNTDCAIPAHPVYYKNTDASLILCPSLKINGWGNITVCSLFCNASHAISFRIKVLVKNLTVFKKPNLYSFHSLQTRRHCTLFWGTWIQSTSAYTIHIIGYLRLGIRFCLFSGVFSD